MVNIIFEKILIENIALHNQLEIEFKPNCLTGIFGKNGSGKSTIFKSLMVGLYGETGEEGSSLTISDLASRRHNKDAFINIHFRVDDDIFEIRKYYKHSKHKNKTVLLKNEKDISGKSVTETHSIISSILVPIDVFRNTVYFGQQIKDFFTALKNSDQKKIFNAIFNFDEWVKYYKITDSFLKQTESELSDYELKSVRIHVQIPERKKYLENLRKTKENEIKKNKERQDSLQNEIEELKQKMDMLCREVSDSEYDESEHKKTESEYNSIINEIEKLQESENQEVSRIKSNLQSKIEFLKLEAKNKFMTEKSTIEESFKDKKEKHLEDIRKIESEKNNTELEKTKTRSKEIKRFDDKIHELQIEKRNLESIKTVQEEKLRSVLAHIKKINIEEIDYEIEQTKKDDSICTKCGQKLGVESKKKVLEDLKVKREDSIRQLEELQSESRDIDDMIKSLNEQIYEIDLVISSTFDERNNKVSEIDSIYDTKIENFKNKLSQLTSELEQIENDCNQQIEQKRELFSSEYKQKINEQINDTNILLQEVKEKIQKQKEILIDKKNHLQKKLLDFDTLLNKIKDLNSTITASREILKTKLSDLQLCKQFKFDDTEIIAYEKDLKELQRNASEIDKKIEEIKQTISIYSFWKEAFSDRGIKSMLIDDSIPVLNEVVKNELDKIVSGQLIVTFDTLSETKSGDIRDKFSVNVLNTVTGADSHKLLSGGEKRIIDVCTLVGLRKLTEMLHGKRFNILLLDEVLDSLDADNSIQYLKVLKLVSKNLSTVIISHNADVKKYCDNIYQL